MSPSRTFPGFGQLYSLSDTGSSRAFTADIAFGDADPLRVTRGEQSIDGATARWAMGAATPGDVVWTRFVGPVLLSAGLAEVLQKQDISGWSVYPVELTGKHGERLDPYFGLIVRGRCGPTDKSRTQRVMKEYPAGQFPVLRGIEFDESTWDGSDIFMSADGKGWIFVTEAVKKAIGRRAKNVCFEALEELEQVVLK